MDVKIRHKLIKIEDRVSDRFEFWLDLSTDCRVSCPVESRKNAIYVLWEKRR